MLNKKVINRVAFILMLMLTISGCEKAPERNNDAVEKDVDLTTEKYVTVEEAKKQIETIKGKEIKGLVFPEYFSMPESNQKIASVKLIPWYSKDLTPMEQALEKMWSDFDKVDWEKVEMQTFPRASDKNYFAYSKHDDKTDLACSVDTEGFFAGLGIEDDNYEYREKEYSFLWGDRAGNDKYLLKGGEVSVLEAVEFVEKSFNDNLSPLEKEQFDYKVQHLYVMRNKDGKTYDYSMIIGRKYNGMAVDTSSCFDLPLGSYYEKVQGGAYIKVIMHCKNQINRLNMCTELLEVAEMEEFEKIIAPYYAVELLDKEVAHVETMGFEDCGLVYLLEQDNRLYEEKEQGVFDMIDSSTYLRPYWVFMIGANTDDNSRACNDTHGRSILIDALNGNLYYYSNTGIY